VAAGEVEEGRQEAPVRKPGAQGLDELGDGHLAATALVVLEQQGGGVAHRLVQLTGDFPRVPLSGIHQLDGLQDGGGLHGVDLYRQQAP